MRTAAEILDKHEAALVTFCHDRQEIEALLLFGSGGRGGLTTRSDLDLALLAAADATVDLLVLRTGLADIMRTDRFDLVMLGQADPLLRQRALSGRVLYCRDVNNLAAFKVKAFKAYDDFRHGQAIRRQYRRARLLGQTAD